jgi:hypothetical protein
MVMVILLLEVVRSNARENRLAVCEEAHSVCIVIYKVVTKI